LLPADTDPRPLLVLLHGDGETAASMLDAWGPAAAARGIVVFAPACPRQEGCTSQSWWKWDGEPSWLVRQIDALAATRAIDRERMWIAGWSGGSTYIGWNTQELERTFAALVIHGGGVRPREASCSATKASIYFLGGDRNPLHYLTEPLHDYYVRCGHDDVTWTVLPGIDHDGERRALASRLGAILDWLETKHIVVQAAARVREAGLDADETLPAPSPLPAAHSSCRCGSIGTSPESDKFASRAVWLLAIVALARIRRVREQ
jgi:predicted esterase